MNLLPRRFFCGVFYSGHRRIIFVYDRAPGRPAAKMKGADMKLTAKKITTTAMIAALAYVVMVFVRIPLMPAAPYLEYDPKDVLFVITGFLLGPLESFISIILVCLIEMVTVSDSGPIGLLMNVIASLFFVMPAVLIYHKKRTLPAAVIGLSCGVIAMTGSMLLWNYLITPLYTGMPREAVVSMLPTIFLPFNLIKAGINMAITLIIYKPISKLLHLPALLGPAEKTEQGGRKKFTPFAIILGVILLAGCILAIILLRNQPV